MRKWEKEDSIRIGKAQIAANTDALTGVKSKNAYIDEEKELDKLIEEGKINDLAVIVCDINDLKLVNDNYGHQQGDGLIRQASALICGIFKRSPVFRIGGDEFLVILEGQDYENRHELLRHLDDITDTNATNGGIVISTGMSDFVKGQNPTLRSLVEEADSLMYQRKRELKQRMGRTGR